MKDDLGGWRVERAGRGAPVVLIFGGPDELGHPPAQAPLPADLFGPRGPEFARISLRDCGGAGYYRGISGLGDTIESTVEALGPILEGLSPARVMTLGRGIGGHAALVYGVLLNADRIVAIQPAAHLIGEVLELYGDRRWGRELAEMPDPAEARRFDVPSLMERRSFDGHACILLGTRRINPHEDAVHLNVIHAHWLARSARVTLHPVPEVADVTTGWLTGHPQAGDLLSRCLLDDARTFAPTPGPPVEAPAVAGSSAPRLFYHPRLTTCTIVGGDPINPTGRAISYAAAGAVDPTATRKMDDELRRWIAENLLLDASPDDLADNLLAFGISRRETLREVDLARFHPHFLGSKRPMERLKKRDWLLETYRQLDRSRRGSRQVDRRPGISLEDFLKGYYSTGRPLVFVDGASAGRPDPRSAKLDDLVRRLEVDETSARDRWAIALDEGTRDPGLLPESWGVGPPFPDLLDRPGQPVGTLWLGLAGSIAPGLDGEAGLLVRQVVGRIRASVAPMWDRLPIEEAGDSPSASTARAEAPTATLMPGEWLFLPAGCWYRLESLEASATLSHRFSGHDG